MLMIGAGSRNALQGLARWMAGMMLVMQFVLTAQACILPLPVSGAVTMTVPCQGMGMGMAACLIQCQKTADQIKPSVDFHFFALSASSVGIEISSVAPASPMVVAVSPLLQRCGGPPLQILFCSFQS